jgi:hypothetical protein
MRFQGNGLYRHVPIHAVYNVVVMGVKGVSDRLSDRFEDLFSWDLR